MFKSIWNGIKWWFTPADEGKSKITRKHGFAHIPAKDDGHVIKVTEPPKAEEIINLYTKLTQAAEQDGKRTRDAIEYGKGELWKPHGIKTEHKEYILQVCGFQKTHVSQGEKVYDPRLIQVINLAMNMYSIEVSQEMLKILDAVNKD